MAKNETEETKGLVLSEKEAAEFKKYQDAQKKKKVDAARWYAIRDLKIAKFDASGMVLTDAEIEEATKKRLAKMK